MTFTQITHMVYTESVYSAQRIKSPEVGLKQRVDDPPIGPGDVLDYSSAEQQLEDAIPDGRSESSGDRPLSGNVSGDL